jgi:hypothetical protein
MVGSLVPALVAALCAAAVWACYAVAEARARHQIAALETAFRAYAAEHGLRVLPLAEPSDAPSDVGPPLVRGEVHGVVIDLTVHSLARPRTTVEAPLPGVANDFVFMVCRRRWSVPRAFEGQALEEARTGNKPFDAAFALLSNRPDLARSLLDRRLAQVILGFPRAFAELRASQNRLLLSWRGMETDPGVLDAAIEVVFTACRRRA